MVNIEENKQMFKKLVYEYIKRDGIQSLVRWLDESDFFTAPASTRYHCSFKGGLCHHSINVYNRLIKLLVTEYGDPVKTELITKDGQEVEQALDKPDYYWMINGTKATLESVTIIGLFHDLSKTNFYLDSVRNVKENGEWKQVPYYQVNPEPAIEMIYGTHAENSVYFLNNYILTTHLENVCIRHHMGGKDTSEEGTNEKNTTVAFNAFPLALLTHIADMEATYLDERV